MNKKYELRFDDQDMRDAYCDALISAGEQNEQIVSLDCDLANSMAQRGSKNAFRNARSIWALWKPTPASMAAAERVGFMAVRAFV
jgi:hypothetical protein